MRPIHARHPAALAAAITLALAACGANDALAPDDWESPSTQSVTAADEATPVGALTASPRIIFGSYRIASHLDLYRMDPGGSNVVRLTSFSGDEAAPAFSWDHKRIAFIRRRVDANNVDRDDIYLMNVDGTGKRWARPAPATFTITDPSWSPDGKQLVVTAVMQGVELLATLDLATGALSLVTGWNSPMQGHDASFSPDGKSIIFVDPDGRTVKQIWPGDDDVNLLNSTTPVNHPSISPDGKSFTYEQVLAGTNNTEIFVQNLATRAVKRLTYSSSYDGWPTWSPDGTRIAFMSRRSGAFQIWTVSSTGGTATRVTHTATDEVSPSWSH